ncbi:hypothetical protein IDJ76_06060 [Mucilaginibacter sp. ZB1P21]|uniref:Uncharacterized protein n=1 Tax=Mucilaginibacter glaciei TaxID=2772109 RepID=A0A926NVP4_9SPHI|nr:hypothetical protein [Mucilaginibacter glaciei]
MTNSNNSLILDEIVNSVASTYNWKDFYKPEIRKLIVLSDSLANNYAGDFKSDSPVLNIKIRRKNGGLQLTTKGESRFEKMYFTSDSDFFLSSSPNNKCRFFKVSDNDGYTLQVKQGEQILFQQKNNKKSCLIYAY